MSIYCTLWELRFPKDGLSFLYDRTDPGIEVYAQAVPPHIQDDGPRWRFLTPPVPDRDTGKIKDYRTVVITTEDDEKGTRRNSQEYRTPLLVMSGKDYAKISFDDLHWQVMTALRERHERAERKVKRKKP